VLATSLVARSRWFSLKFGFLYPPLDSSRWQLACGPFEAQVLSSICQSGGFNLPVNSLLCVFEHSPRFINIPHFSTEKERDEEESEERIEEAISVVYSAVCGPTSEFDRLLQLTGSFSG